MGATFTQDLVEQGLLDINTMLVIHLQHNHYPPVSIEFVPDAREAIRQCNNELPHTVITMVNGLDKTAIDIVRGLHLETFLDNDNNDGE